MGRQRNEQSHLQTNNSELGLKSLSSVIIRAWILTDHSVVQFSIIKD